MNELQPFIDLLALKHGWVGGVAAWIGTVRVPLKFISASLQGALTSALGKVAASPEQDDDALVLRVLGSKAYRLAAFLFDLLASVKLPTTATFKALQTKP